MININSKRAIILNEGGSMEDLGTFQSLDALKLTLADITTSKVYTCTLGIYKTLIVATINSSTNKYFTIITNEDTYVLHYQNGAWTDESGSLVVDNNFNSTSTNPVENRVINEALNLLLSDLGNKIDKVTGKGLSTNDFSNTYKTKLDGIETGANKTTVDSALSASSTNPVQNKIINTALENKVDKISGKGLSANDFTDTLKTKLDGIASGANKTVVDASLSTTSTNPVQNKVINTALGNKVDKVTGKGLSTNDYTAADKNNVTLNTTMRHGHENKTVLDGTTASYTTAEKTRLSGIAEGAQANVIETIKLNNQALTPTNKAVNIDLSNYALTSELNQFVEKETGKGLSTNDYTNAEKNNVASNTSARHTHSNKTVLDGTTASYTTNEKTKLAGLENYDDTSIQAALLEKLDKTEIGFEELPMGGGMSIRASGTINKLFFLADDKLYFGDPDNTGNEIARKQDLNNKVDKVTGKGLSTNDYTTAEKTKLGTMPTIETIPYETLGGGIADTLDWLVTNQKPSGLYWVFIDEVGNDYSLFNFNFEWRTCIVNLVNDVQWWEHNDTTQSWEMKKSLEDLQSKKIITADTTAGAKTVTGVNNREYRFLYENGITSLTLNMFDSMPSSTTEFELQFSIMFKSGSTATTFTNNLEVYFTGNNCVNGTFTPISNKTYELIIWWNGNSPQGCVRGV